MNNINILGNKQQNTINHKQIKAIGNNVINFWRLSHDNIITFGSNFKCNNIKIVIKGSNNKLIIHDNVRFTGHILIVGNNRTISIGENTTVQGAYILSRDADVFIGNNCMLSREIEIRSTDVHKIYDINTGEQLNHAKDVNIGEHCWIAARAIISKGTTIPNGCIVGASSFLNKTYPEENCIIAGIPGKIVKRNIRWER
ncbi:hypothetical protein ACPWL5_004531 [Escherichia coli]